MKRLSTILAALLTVILTASSAVAAQKVRSLCEIHYPSDQRIQWRCQKLKEGDTPQRLFGGHWLDVLHFNRLDRRHFLAGMSIKVPVHPQQLNSFTPLPATLPQAASEPKFILIDQSEMFLGAYQNGKLVYSFPIALGMEGFRVPNGEYRIEAADRDHHSNLYQVEEIGRPYPMHYALRFWIDKTREDWPSYWIHGRDLPGYPASHGCIGLYDEEMQVEYYSAYDKKVNGRNYRALTKPYLQAAKVIYQWVVGPGPDSGKLHKVDNGPKVLITGSPPESPER
ncbi:L,D-transpeptidase [Geomonas sp.]|uniref:L,D-transpeptidase n=1 Tax=Geomonas sp. TaxID=2651584 RepID=UPI002B484554|nr:L,D-transpeptidase [Geomonas sp.]HJV33761.1 L,D-transpeptidase [Geomonas sp.]